MYARPHTHSLRTQPHSLVFCEAYTRTAEYRYNSHVLLLCRCVRIVAWRRVCVCVCVCVHVGVRVSI